MVVFPNAKINIGLNIINKRVDGFHNIETVFYPIVLKDALEIITQKKQQEQLVDFTQSGFIVDVAAEDNICVKAYYLLKKDFPLLPNVQMHLLKQIPMGAGLGGGSSNAAFAIGLLNKQYQLNLTVEQQQQYAAMLGSDCAFFIHNFPCYATGRGEVLQKSNIDLSGFDIYIVHPGIHVNTAKAFAALHATDWEKSNQLAEAIQLPVTQWKQHVKNGFEPVVFKQHAAIKDVKEKLYNLGAIYASMSGTGSSVYGIFEKENQPSFDFPENFFCKKI
jgi:4-diphosphocytidyl-2-C-methyl-D-erythritol kinase